MLDQRCYFKGPLLIPLVEIDLDSGLFIEDDIINAQNTLDKGIFRSFFIDFKNFISHFRRKKLKS